METYAKLSFIRVGLLPLPELAKLNDYEAVANLVYIEKNFFFLKYFLKHQIGFVNFV